MEVVERMSLPKTLLFLSNVQRRNGFTAYTFGQSTVTQQISALRMTWRAIPCGPTDRMRIRAPWWRRSESRSPRPVSFFLPSNLKCGGFVTLEFVAFGVFILCELFCIFNANVQMRWVGKRSAIHVTIFVRRRHRVLSFKATLWLSYSINALGPVRMSILKM